MRKSIIVLLLVLFSVFAVSAQGLDDQGQPNDPVVNERANACFEGGSQEGRCVSDGEWTCGWYLIRWEANPSYIRPSFCAPIMADNGGTEPVIEPLICRSIIGSSAGIPEPFPMERCANSEWGYDDWYEDGSYDYLYYFGSFEGVCPAAPATHTLHSGPSPVEFTSFALSPYNLTVADGCTYELLPS